MDKLEVFKNCTVEGLVVKLPNIVLDRKLYIEVAKTLELVGGKWNKKLSGFLFKNEPAEILDLIKNESSNIKKEYQFFATPDILADKLVDLAELKSGDTVLEPSAGQGAIIRAILRKRIDVNISAIEIMPANCIILSQKGIVHKQQNFLETTEKFKKIIANPPFSKNQDIHHIKHMYDLLEEGGRLVSLSSNHWRMTDGKKETEFRNWISEVNANIIEVEKGAFKESGTNISCCIIIIDKK